MSNAKTYTFCESNAKAYTSSLPIENLAIELVTLANKIKNKGGLDQISDIKNFLKSIEVATPDVITEHISAVEEAKLAIIDSILKYDGNDEFETNRAVNFLRYNYGLYDGNPDVICKNSLFGCTPIEQNVLDIFTNSGEPLPDDIRKNLAIIQGTSGSESAPSVVGYSVGVRKYSH